MVPQQFANFFATSAGASAALIGLLFVAVSRAEGGGVFGSEARADRHAAATGAFAALANAFFVSLGVLVPGVNPGGFVLVVGALALLNTLGLGRELWRRRLEGRYAGRGALLVVGGLVLYGIEIWCGLTLLRDAPAEADGPYYTVLALLLVGVYVVGLGRAWELLGAPQKGVLAWLFSPRERDDTRAAGKDEPRSERGTGDRGP